MSSYTLSFQQGHSTQTGSFNTRRSQGFVSPYAHSSLKPDPRFSEQANLANHTRPLNLQSVQNSQFIPLSNNSSKPFSPTFRNSQASPKQAEPKQSDKKEDGEGINPLGFAFAIMSLVGAPCMLIPALLGIRKDKDSKLYFKPNIASRKLGAFYFKKDTEAVALQKLEKKLLFPYKFGKGLLASGIIPKTIIGVIYGIQSGQPSMLLAHLCQLPLVKLIWKENKIATTLVYAMGGLFTLGFINDIQNGLIRDGKKPGTKEKIREYDMTHFKALFGSHNGLSAGQRIGGFFTECWKMLKFSGQDHVITVKRALNQLGKLVHGEKNDLTDLKSTGSTSKSSVGFLLNYASTIPAIFAALFLNSEGKAAKYFSRYSMVTTIMAGLMLDFGMFLVALNGKNWAERVPLVGTSMEMGGTIAGYSPLKWIQPIALACQQLGGGLNSIFYANKAEND